MTDSKHGLTPTSFKLGAKYQYILTICINIYQYTRIYLFEWNGLVVAIAKQLATKHNNLATVIILPPVCTTQYEPQTHNTQRSVY